MPWWTGRISACSRTLLEYSGNSVSPSYIWLTQVCRSACSAFAVKIAKLLNTLKLLEGLEDGEVAMLLNGVLACIYFSLNFNVD